MGTRPFYLVDAFTRDPLQGNPAGVLPYARGLSEATMRAVAREVNASETAFVLGSREADFRFRFFTPTQEVPFCGHATVAAVRLLQELGEIAVEGDFARARVETGAGIIPVDVIRTAEGFRVDMTQARPAFRTCSQPADRLLQVLGGDEEALRADLPLELAYTGLWHLIVPVLNAEEVDGLLPDLRALAALNRELGVVTTHVFAQEGGVYHCRDFAPAAGVDEDPVTGSASGALGAYLLRHRQIRPSHPLTLRQGEACGRPGEVRVVVEGSPGEPASVVVGGYAVVSLRGEIRTQGAA